ncbi:IS66 family insertion sequence element accessory protein TnpA [Paenibacillus mendelii]|uniref:IS66 family insertion sequence element accessory protein TnpB n=1 Tax=Paenibacillus mendelii TaxID=206163 RepID=A0ABV6JBM6_9BACL|nr:IS66 family insertion sequence element accessory protein TnpB [Paenibacillus mendelii]MCQ6563874.1 IS66 family insertion sequence element accessory protein TnpB [Paenibacillus mendelii]
MNAREQRRQDWQVRIAAYRASGLTMKAWCNANQCSIEQLKYWLYKIKRGSSQTTPDPKTSPVQFVPLTAVDPPGSVSSDPSLILHIGEIRVELHSGFDPKLLREVIHVLTSSC